MRSRARSALALTLSIAGCALFPSLDGLSGACVFTPSLDADAGASWRVAGNAELRGDYAELTALRETQAGLVGWRGSLDFRSSQTSFDLSLTRVSTSVGMGVAVALLDEPVDNITCANDYDLCVLGAGATGIAVIVRTVQRNNREPQAPFVAVVDASADPTQPPAAGASAPLPASFLQTLGTIDDTAPPPDASWHAVAISIADGAIDVSIDGIAYLTHVALPSPAPAQGSWWIGGSTDQAGQGLLAEERATFRNVKLTATACATK